MAPISRGRAPWVQPRRGACRPTHRRHARRDRRYRDEQPRGADARRHGGRPGRGRRGAHRGEDRRQSTGATILRPSLRLPGPCRQRDQALSWPDRCSGAVVSGHLHVLAAPGACEGMSIWDVDASSSTGARRTVRRSALEPGAAACWRPALGPSARRRGSSADDGRRPTGQCAWISRSRTRPRDARTEGWICGAKSRRRRCDHGSPIMGGSG